MGRGRWLLALTGVSVAGCLEAPPAAVGGADAGADGADADAGPPDLDEGLIAHYRLDAIVAGAAADHVGGHDATCADCPADTPGQIGEALQFDGVDALVAEDELALRPLEATVAVWLRREDLDGYAGIVGKAFGDEGDESSWDIYLDETGQIIFYSMPDVSLPTAIVAPQGAWTHVAITWSASDRQIFVDGADRGSVSQPALSMQHDESPIRIGMGTENGTPMFGFMGALDDLRIYGRALSTAEVAALATPP